MTEHDLEPLSAEALAMLESDRQLPNVPLDVSERVFEHLSTSIALGGMGGGHAAGQDGAGTAAGGAADGATALSRRAIAWIATAFVAGSGVGATLHAGLTKPATAPVAVAASATVSRPPEVASSRVPDEPAPIDVRSLPPVTASSPTAVPAPSHGSAGKDVDLAMERELVERARMALARGQGAEALAALDRHAREFPRGRMAEERETLAIQALVQAGRTDEARARAARFRSAFPHSVFLPAVDALLEAPR